MTAIDTVRDRRQGIRHGLVARLGGEGSKSSSAVRARDLPRRLSASIALQPRRHGHRAVFVFNGRQDAPRLRVPPAARSIDIPPFAATLKPRNADHRDRHLSRRHPPANSRSGCASTTADEVAYFRNGGIPCATSCAT